MVEFILFKKLIHEKILYHTVCFTPKKILIGRTARNKMRQFPELSIFKSKRFLGEQCSNLMFIKILPGFWPTLHPMKPEFMSIGVN